MSSQTVTDGKVVLIRYVLRDGEGELIDESDEGEPLAYLHGSGNIVPGLEREIAGKQVGDRIQAIVMPRDGYGERDERGVFDVPRDQFPGDVDIEEGMHFGMEGEGGQVFPVWVTAVDGDQVTLDANHPLAGVTLHFDVTVESIRDATDEERQHGHVHGPCCHHH